MLNEVIHGDALEVLRSLPTHSVDAIVTDPPAGIAFMGKDWDNPNTFPIKNRGSRKTGSGNPTNANGFANGVMFDSSSKGRDAFIDFMADIMSEALRVIKPGGHALVWSLPRTSHWTALALEYAGFDIRDCITHIFGSGMPKSHDISKAIDRMQGMEREVIGRKPDYIKYNTTLTSGNTYEMSGNRLDRDKVGMITAPASPDAQQWEGWGTGLKPSHELWWLARSPLSEPSIAANVLKWGTGGLNIDKCRIGYKSESDYRNATPGSRTYNHANHNKTTPILSENTYRKMEKNPLPPNKQGRWPANLLMSHTLFCTQDACAEGCPVALLDMQSGVRKTGSGMKSQAGKTKYSMFGQHTPKSDDIWEASEGGASRYFQTFRETPDVPFIYTSKASRSERNKGCEALPVSTNEDTNLLTSSWRTDPRSPNGGYENKPAIPQANNHPTVKPLALCRYLVNLITPPGGIVLDMFCGSGSVLVACVMEGYNYIGVDQDSDYCEIARARLAYATQNAYTCKDNMTI